MAVVEQGQRYGKLVVLRVDHNRSGYVICKCDCGKTKSIRKASLTKTKEPTRSCGCLQREASRVVGTSNVAENTAKQVGRNRELDTNVQIVLLDRPMGHNTSGVSGVHYSSYHKKWQAYGNLHGKRKHLGYYATKEEAIQERLKWEDENFKPIRDKVLVD